MLLERQVRDDLRRWPVAEADAPTSTRALLKLRCSRVVNAAAEHSTSARLDRRRRRHGAGLLASGDLGHERIGSSWPPDHVPSLRKLAAFERVAKLATASELVERTRSRSRAATRRHAPDRAWRHGNHLRERSAGLGAIRAAAGGPSVPSDLSVIGFDDSALMSCTSRRSRPSATARGDRPRRCRDTVADRGSPVSAEELFSSRRWWRGARRDAPDVETASLALNRPKITGATVPLAFNCPCVILAPMRERDATKAAARLREPAIAIERRGARRSSTGLHSELRRRERRRDRRLGGCGAPALSGGARR